MILFLYQNHYLIKLSTKKVFLYGLVALKKYINKLNPNREKEQYILALEYFCKFQVPTLNNIQDLRNTSIIKAMILDFMELMPDEYDFQFDLNGKLDLIKNILIIL